MRYDGSSTEDPTTEIGDYDDDCLDESTSDLVPYLALEAGSQVYDETFTVGLTVVSGQFKWTLNSNTFLSDWAEPSK